MRSLHKSFRNINKHLPPVVTLPAFFLTFISAVLLLTGSFGGISAAPPVAAASEADQPFRAGPEPAIPAAVLNVNSTADNLTGGDGLVTLREAIIAANTDTTTDLGQTGSGADTIVLQAGATYTMARSGRGEDAAATGDFDVTQALTIQTDAPGTKATINGATLDRLFDLHAGSLTLTDLVITNGRTDTGSATTEGGGGILARNGNLTLTRVSVSNNQFITNSFSGGGLAANYAGTGGTGTISITDSTFTGNATTRNGGAMYLTGANLTVNIMSSTLDNNQAFNLRDGGAIDVETNATLTITNSTISNNNATDDGGAIFTFGAAAVSIRNSTISNNIAGGDGGGLNGTSTFNLLSTILANNTAALGPDCAATVTSGTGFNLIENTTACTITGTTTGNITGTDPNLAALANNGGLTRTQALNTGSPAINAGANPLGLANDQRGAPFLRVVGSQADIGAFELAPPTAAFVSVSGRVLTQSGRGVTQAIVHLTDQNGNIREARTNQFGYYRFADIEVGQTLIFNVFSKSYQFTTRVVNVEDSISDLDFIAQK